MTGTFAPKGAIQSARTPATSGVLAKTCPDWRARQVGIDVLQGRYATSDQE